MVVLIGELMKQADRYIADGLHPRIIAEVGACCWVVFQGCVRWLFEVRQGRRVELGGWQLGTAITVVHKADSPPPSPPHSIAHVSAGPPAARLFACPQGYEIAKKDLLEFLDGFKEAVDPTDRWGGLAGRRQAGWERD
jgi:hypothetical protein